MEGVSWHTGGQEVFEDRPLLRLKHFYFFI